MTLRKFFVVLFFAACSSSPDSRPAVGNVGDEVDSQQEQDRTEACKDGEKRSCHTTLGTHEGVTTCFVGVQFCVAGEWSECGN